MFSVFFSFISCLVLSCLLFRRFFSLSVSVFFLFSLPLNLSLFLSFSLSPRVWCVCVVSIIKNVLEWLLCAGQRDQVENLAEAAHGRCWFQEEERHFPDLEREQRTSSTSLGTTDSHSGARSQTVLERPPFGEVQWNHRACGGARGRRGQNTKRCPGTSYRDTVLTGGLHRTLDEQV